MINNNIPIYVAQLSKAVPTRIGQVLYDLGFALARVFPCRLADTVPIYRAENVVLPNGTTITIYIKEGI